MSQIHVFGDIIPLSMTYVAPHRPSALWRLNLRRNAQPQLYVATCMSRCRALCREHQASPTSQSRHTGDIVQTVTRRRPSRAPRRFEVTIR
jgi:hypothetical protein